ncbi:MAG: 2-oxo acid dehydrogenase subunit E2 [Anaerovoracaceae bacterium]|jgi:pyruvate dehydrogenase E2 component (dihydrolipoamide acetyltransferase)
MADTILTDASRATGMVKITPRARRVAKEKGLDLKTLNILGTGYQGGISEKDILNYLASNKVRVSPIARRIAKDQGIELDGITGSGVHGKIIKRDLVSIPVETDTVEAVAATVQTDAQYSPDGKEILEVIPYSGVRRIIGERLSQSKFTSPHLYFTQKVNLEKLLDFRKQINEAQDKKTSVTDYIARACVITLQKYPDMNSTLAGEQIIKYKTINLGIAVAAPSGLIVPVVKNAEKKSLLEISKDSGVLIDKARAGKLSPDEYGGGTFTVSNLGMFGIENFTAIINPPEAGILAVSATKDEPFVETDENGNKTITIKPMMNITLSVDHRIIDGLLAAQVVTEIKRLLENPIELLI